MDSHGAWRRARWLWSKPSTTPLWPACYFPRWLTCDGGFTLCSLQPACYLPDSHLGAGIRAQRLWIRVWVVRREGWGLPVLQSLWKHLFQDGNHLPPQALWWNGLPHFPGTWENTWKAPLACQRTTYSSQAPEYHCLKESIFLANRQMHLLLID